MPGPATATAASTSASSVVRTLQVESALTGKTIPKISNWDPLLASLRLSPLPAQEIAAMLDALLGAAPDGASRGELAARCGGVPLYAEEFAQLASQQDAPAVPPTLAAVIGARLDTLSREHRAGLPKRPGGRH